MYLLLQQPHYQQIVLPPLQISELTSQSVLQASLSLLSSLNVALAFRLTLSILFQFFHVLSAETPCEKLPVVTTRVVFLYRVLLGIASYTEQNLTIRSRLYGVECFYYSEQVKRSRIFLLFRVGYKDQNISAIPSRLCGVEYFCYSDQIIPSRTFLLF